MTLNAHIRSTVQRPWFIALIFLAIFMLTTGYKYGWDDQHLEIPLLKSLIDPGLYPNDYYVDSLKKNFTSFFYPILAKLITVDQIPQAYLILYLIARYLLFYWAYRIWLLITERKDLAFYCTAVFILMSRVHEFMYRTFSHQEFALGFIFAGVYFLYARRFYLSAIILGLTANFHAIYSLFPMIFMCFYLLFRIRTYGWKRLIIAPSLFILTALPFLIWTFQNRLTNVVAGGEINPRWLDIYIVACPQNFIFGDFSAIPFKNIISDINVFFYVTQTYLTPVALLLFNFIFNKDFRRDKMAVTISLCCTGLLALCVIFTYVYPERFFVDLNLIRANQYLLFILTGYAIIFLVKQIEQTTFFFGFILGILFIWMKYNEPVSSLAIVALMAVFILKRAFCMKAGWARWAALFASILMLVICLTFVVRTFYHIKYPYFTFVFIGLSYLTVIGVYFSHLLTKPSWPAARYKHLYIILPLCMFMFQYMHYHKKQVYEENYGHGFWALQQSWLDMQYFVKAETPKDATILIPYDMEMCGFRMFSERPIVVSFRDCGIVGFDYSAGVEWYRRVSHVLSFKTNVQASTRKAIQAAVYRYHAQYIVFMRYATPEHNSIMERVYTNRHFALYRVKPDLNFNDLMKM